MYSIVVRRLYNLWSDRSPVSLGPVWHYTQFLLFLLNKNPISMEHRAAHYPDIWLNWICARRLILTLQAGKYKPVTKNGPKLCVPSFTPWGQADFLLFKFVPRKQEVEREKEDCDIKQWPTPQVGCSPLQFSKHWALTGAGPALGPRDAGQPDTSFTEGAYIPLELYHLWGMLKN